MLTALSKEQSVGVVGAGAMGGGIAQVALTAGHPVVLMDLDPAACARAVEAIGQRLQRGVDKGRMTAAARDAAWARLTTEAGLEELAECRLIVEAAAEDLEVKRAIFKTLAAACPAETILASNTSSISINAIAAGQQGPGRIAGMHFFNPAPVMQLVEIVSGLETDPRVAEVLFATAAAWGKAPVAAQSTPGFIVNRVARPFYAEALNLLNEQATDAATIDAVVTEAGGFPLGPLALMDLIGHDVNYAVTCSVHAAYYGDPRFRPSLIQKALIDAGRLGRKSGRGFYDYREGVAKPPAATEPGRAAPRSVVLAGPVSTDLPGPAATLLGLIEAAGIGVSREESTSDEACLRLPAGCELRLTSGATATAEAARRGCPVVLFDLALDYATAGRVALAASDGCPAAARDQAVGLFQALGKAVSLIDDAPGLIVMRTVAMLANEAADALHQGIAAAAAIDLAMTRGVNYPRGPLAWADALGTERLLATLRQLEACFGDGRYRPSLRLQRIAARGCAFHKGTTR